MTVEEAFATSSNQPLSKGVVEREWADWCDVGTIEIKSGKMTAITFGVLNLESGVSINVSPNQYRVQAKIMSFEGNLGICRARAMLFSESVSPDLKLLGNVIVEFARLAIGDVTAASDNLTLDDRKAMSKAVRPYSSSYGTIATLRLPSKEIKLACILAGFGHGRYPIHSLSIGGNVIGMEIEFLPDGFVYDRWTSAPDTKADLLAKLEMLRDMISKPNPPKS